jgi:hypothetical protein
MPPFDAIVSRDSAGAAHFVAVDDEQQKHLPTTLLPTAAAAAAAMSLHP